MNWWSARCAGVTTFQVDDDTIRNLQAEINWCKISLIAPEDYARVCAATHRQPPSGLEPSQFVDVYKAYEAEKTNRNEIDFDDILLIVCHLMESDEEVASAIRSNIRWLTVDEYQDVSPLQHRLLTRLARLKPQYLRGGRSGADHLLVRGRK